MYCNNVVCYWNVALLSCWLLGWNVDSCECTCISSYLLHINIPDWCCVLNSVVWFSDCLSVRRLIDQHCKEILVKSATSHCQRDQGIITIIQVMFWRELNLFLSKINLFQQNPPINLNKRRDQIEARYFLVFCMLRFFYVCTSRKTTNFTHKLDFARVGAAAALAWALRVLIITHCDFLTLITQSPQ